MRAKPGSRIASLEVVRLADLVVEDQRSLRAIPLYADLERVLLGADVKFRVLTGGDAGWDRATYLNLTTWGANDDGGVLSGRRIPADVVAHHAWHHLAARHLASRSGKMSADALFLGEAIASAFDVYLVGYFLSSGGSPASLDEQVVAMADVASRAGLAPRKFASLLESIARNPAKAFEDLRSLLFDATSTLAAARGASEALALLVSFESRRFWPLLHHFELPSWVLYARAHAPSLRRDARVRRVEAKLREAPVSLAWLAEAWISPSLPGW